MTSGNSSQLTLRKATLQDLDSIKTLVDQHKTELGFVIRAALEKSIGTSEVIVAVDLKGNLVGFVHYRHRKDGQTTLYNIVVKPVCQGQGIGSKLLDWLSQESRERKQEFILLKCPIHLPANEFYQDYGFTVSTTEKGKKRPLNIWRIEV